ncbi:carboxylating nicotinate-nucleotide diphosphorylase [Candidiatus Paracoxiella cheracis]|uniref:carboxylating nicotinate-nucleotide diphosphorylase n=1 Tax=Candidiatus Paracoxiella cheracis TaxID=3405120 RepID=UPI003BF46E94
MGTTQTTPSQKSEKIAVAVAASLAEDIGTGDITAELIPEGIVVSAEIITRESAVICGTLWVEEVYRQVDETVKIDWKINDGDHVKTNQSLVTLSGSARSLLTGERCAINWLQTLSGTATKVNQYVKQLAGTHAQLLDTRKTIPGLRYAQKYAVRCGGGKNHRLGLYDAYLIKENHIASCGSIQKAVDQARMNHPDKPIEVEVENIKELQQAIDADAHIIMLDNFDLPSMHEAVRLNGGRAKLEVSGGVDLDTLRQIAETGVDYISVGALTKNVQAIDLSMRLIYSS